MAHADIAVLMLEDGTRFDGVSLGADGEEVGEVCFNTSMTGYQEIMSDPSYAGQIVTMTYTQIGNVGINPEDMESDRPWIRGFIVKEASRIPSNFRCREDLSGFLKRHRIPAIQGVDTRKLVRILRDKGAQRGVLSTRDFDAASLIAKARAWPGLAGMNLTGEVTCKKPRSWKQSVWKLGEGSPEIGRKHLPHKVAVLDFGIKRNILRNLVKVGCDLTVLPATSTFQEVMSIKPDGIFLSNGPGDPEAVTQGIETIRALLEVGKPIFGICLGHQMLALAMGARTSKMKFGHRGGNHPVQNLATGMVEVTAQNHGFMVEETTLPHHVEVTHRSLFDGSVEGLRLTDRPAFSVQYHPEASPGPHDSRYLFEQFSQLMQR